MLGTIIRNYHTFKLQKLFIDFHHINLATFIMIGKIYILHFLMKIEKIINNGKNHFFLILNFQHKDHIEHTFFST